MSEIHDELVDLKDALRRLAACLRDANETVAEIDELLGKPPAEEGDEG